MRVNSISPVYAQNVKLASFKSDKKLINEGINGEFLDMQGNASKYFSLVENVSNKKVGSKFIIEPKNPEYKGLRLLITPETEILGRDFSIGIKNTKTPSFKGKLYGSIRLDDDGPDKRMKSEYMKFWTEGKHNEILNYYLDSITDRAKNDYNFFIPSDGDGTRYKDITSLQGGVTKPASIIPATLNGQPMSLVQNVISNYAKTGKLDNGYDFINVKPAQGSAYAFLEGLKSGKISVDKPIVFSWGDNFTDVNISRLMKEHEKNNSGFTITTIPVDKDKTKSLSIVKIDSFENKKIDEFTEKPQDDDYISSCVIPELGEGKCLSAVGPYIISTPVLKWIKENYTKNPESFLNPDKGYDFSSMVIAPALRALNEGEITDNNGNHLDMKLAMINENETWSDLGSQKDFSQAMKYINAGYYKNLPFEIRNSIRNNVDERGNITFSNQARKLFDKMIDDLNINAKNTVVYLQQ